MKLDVTHGHVEKVPSSWAVLRHSNRKSVKIEGEVLEVVCVRVVDGVGSIPEDHSTKRRVDTNRRFIGFLYIYGTREC